MIKAFCDGCGKPLSQGENVVNENTRYEPAYTFVTEERNVRVSCEVIVAVDGRTNHGELCLSCLLTALTEGAKQ